MEKYFDINESGYSVRCKLYCNDQRNIHSAVIFGHGFGGHKDTKAAAKFADKLLSKYKTACVITFDWPCHGKDNSPRLTLDECSDYLTLVIGYAKKTYQTEDVYAYATSFGGFMILKYISDNGNPFKRIALRCPAVCMYDSITSKIMDDDSFALLAKGRDVLVGFDRKIKINQAFLDELKQTDLMQRDFMDYADDILILHGTKDEVVSFEKTKEFSENNVIELLPIENADHRFMDPKKMDLAIHEIIEFLFTSPRQ